MNIFLIILFVYIAIASLVGTFVIIVYIVSLFLSFHEEKKNYANNAHDGKTNEQS